MTDHRIFVTQTKLKSQTKNYNKSGNKRKQQNNNKKKERKQENYIRKCCKNTKETYINLAFGYFLPFVSFLRLFFLPKEKIVFDWLCKM